MRRIAVAVVVVIVALAGTAEAYPHYQFSSGTDRCSECHLAPAGGGLLTEWGRGELGETLSRGGNGRLLHGLEPPSWLTLGGDLRIAALVNDTGSADGAEVAVFPMQLELAARVGSERFSATAVVGLRGATRGASARDPEDEAGPLRGAAVISREHFVSYQDDARRWVVRAGRFAAPFGLRLVDHTAYVRRYLGYGLFEEPYAIGVARLTDRDELHVTAFASDPLQTRQQRFGGAALYERRSLGRAVRGSARVTTGAGQTIAVAGASTTWWLEGPAVVVLAELDGGWQQFTDADAGRPMATAYLGPTWLPTRGVSVTVAGELHAEDARVLEANRYAASVGLSVLPYAHVEVAASGRYQWIGTDDHAATAMVQLHYLP